MALSVNEVFGVFPQGVILAWYAQAGAFPAGWAVCDGTNGTPDLRNRFLMGVSDMADVGKPGGANFIRGARTTPHQLTVEQLPAHTHSQPVRLHQGPEGVAISNEYSPGLPSGSSNNWSWGGSATGSGGAGAPHEHAIPDVDNRPLYNTVIYIMKV